MEPALKRIIRFKLLNLLEPWPMRGKFDAIFCRNVVIYFEESTQAKIWSRFPPLLSPGGFLYVGHSERLAGPAASAFSSDGVTTYRFREGAQA
jgi:chemotaxis protein methyltransferase CheR